MYFGQSLSQYSGHLLLHSGMLRSCSGVLVKRHKTVDLRCGSVWRASYHPWSANQQRDSFTTSSNHSRRRFPRHLDAGSCGQWPTVVPRIFTHRFSKVGCPCARRISSFFVDVLCLDGERSLRLRLLGRFCGLTALSLCRCHGSR